MTIRNGIVALILAVLIGVGGWYVFMHTQSLPHTLSEAGDRQVNEDTDYYTIQVVYPNTTRLATRTDTKPGADKRAVATIESYVNDSVATFKNDLSQMLTDEEKARIKENNAKYAFSIAYHPYNSGSFASFEFDTYEDTGGAHPNGFYKTFVFDLSGKEVALADLFTPNSDYLTRIATEAKTQVTKQVTDRLGKEAAQSLFNEGLAPTVENFSNWVDNDGQLVFYIPPYQAAAYAAGSFEVHIPLSDLKDILKPGIQ